VESARYISMDLAPDISQKIPHAERRGDRKMDD
jgi:hypothetical protein